MSSEIENLLRGVDEVVPSGDFVALLSQSKPLVIKLGFDPTTQDLHLGHTLLLHKARQFQKLGHQVVILMGDFTARIGDPSGKSVTRPVLTSDQVQSNAKAFVIQVMRILDSQHTKVVFNSSWYNSMSAESLIHLCMQYTVARILERNDFSDRYHSNEPLGIHELIYPVLQGYDSVELKADIELGGTDQKFNLLMGRHYQKLHGQNTQVVMMLPLLEGTDGVKKMSKSYDNHISINAPSKEMYGQLMSISDDLMWRYFNLIAMFSQDEINQWQQEVNEGGNPKHIKMKLAHRCVACYYDQAEADRVEADFVQIYKNKNVDNIAMETISISVLTMEAPLSYILKQMGLVSSSSEGGRMIRSGAVRINDARITDEHHLHQWKEGDVVRVGKRRMKRISP